MKATVALRRASLAAASISSATAVMPDEFSWDISNGPTGLINHTTGVTIDSGQNVNTINIGDTATVGASSLDGEIVYNSAPTGSSYLCAVNPLSERGVYMRAKYRFNGTGATSVASSIGLIVWTDLGSSTADSSCHMVHSISTNTVFVQQVTNGVVGSTIGGPWTVPNVGSAWQEIEYAIDAAHNAMVLRLPNGSIESFTHSSLGTLVGVYPTWEPFYVGGYASNKWDPEIAEINASTYTAMNAGQVVYLNALLALDGYGPVGPPPPATKPVVVGSACTNTTSVSLDLIPYKAGDLKLTFAQNYNSSTAPAIESGWTNIDGSGSSTCSIRAAWQLCTVDSTLEGGPGGEKSGTWTAGTDASHVTTVILRDAAVGAGVTAGATGGAINVPAVSMTVTDGTSVIVGCYISRNSSGTPAVPTSTPCTKLAVFDNVSAGGDSSSWVTTNGVTSWTTTTASNGGSAPSRCACVEVVYAP